MILRSLLLSLILSFLSGHTRLAMSAPVLYGSSDLVDLFRIDLVTGAGARVGSLPGSATEIEFDKVTGRAYLQYLDGAFLIQQFNINTAAAVGPTVVDAASFNGLEFVGATLYGTAITGPGSPSTLRTLNPNTGVSVVIGPTGVGPISGLAYNETTGVMYGIAGGPGPAVLYTLNLQTGLASMVGNTGIQAGSLEFGPDGNLYAGSTGSAGGSIYRINPSNGVSTLVGPTGFAAVTGLTLVDEIPEVETKWLISLSVIAFFIHLRLNRMVTFFRSGFLLSSHHFSKPI